MASIYLLDDDRDITFITNTWLSRKGYTVQHFSSSADFLKTVARKQPDILLIDHLIAEQNMNGLLLCKKLRNELGYKGSIFIFTAFPVTEAELASSGADGMIAKPFDLNALIDTLAQALA